MAKVYLGIPTYDGRCGIGMLNNVMRASELGQLKQAEFASTSLLPHCFNILLANALNARPTGVTHFGLLHEDIEILTKNWLDEMLILMDGHQADVISVVSPIKNGKGLTSTALDVSKGDGIDPFWQPKRLSMKEIFDRPPTFTDPNLLVNTGCMIAKIAPYLQRTEGFRFDDRIVILKDGTRAAQVAPEDWLFSRGMRQSGAKLIATREIEILHHGRTSFTNQKVWGEWETDQ